MNPLLTEAFRLMTIGYSVIPLGDDKRPRISSWKPFQEKAADEEQIMKWWEMWPHANIGIVTGRVSGITVIDVDAYKPGAITTETFPATYAVATGNGGTHLYYQYAPGLTISAGAYPQYPHLDIRNDGGFIVAPPSVTNYDGKGGVYTVKNNVPLAPFPSEMFPAAKIKKTLADTVGAGTGSRNDSLASIIGQLLLAQPEKKWYSDVLPAVEKINATYNPPLPQEELLATFTSIMNRERASRTEASGGSNNDDENELRAAFKKNKAEGTYALAQWLTKKYSIITLGEQLYEFFVYEDGIYFQAMNHILYPEVQRILGGMTTQSAKVETVNKVASMTMQPRSVFTGAPLNFVNLANGVYDRDTKTLLPHDPKYKFTHKFPIIYDKDAVCPLTDAFLDTVLEPEQRLAVEEWIGYFFYRAYPFKKAIIFVGEGDTGKTTLLEVLTHLLGTENISSVTLQKMSSDKFAAVNLFEKHANLVDELSARDIVDTAAFKIATGGGSIAGERKFGNAFVFRNHSKLTFATNKIPDVKDFDDEAYFNRWMPLRFEKTIVKKIPNFIRILSTDAERSGLFNLGMRGLDRLLEQGRFSYNKSSLETKMEMMRSSSSIAQFAAEMCERQDGNEISKEEMYESYTKFCSTRDVAAETMKMLGTRLPSYVTYLSEGKMYNGTSRDRCWRNVALKKTDEQQGASSEADTIFDNYAA